MSTSGELEVEEKFVALRLDEFQKALISHGFENTGTENQKDTYFSDTLGKFVLNNTCLRIRECVEQGIISIDFKGKSADLNTSLIAKIERNLHLKSGEAGAAADLIGALGFAEHTTVCKERLSFVKHFGEFRATFAFDQIVNAGSFVEIEVVTKRDGSISNAAEIISELKKEYGDFLGEIVNLPYRDIVAGKRAGEIFGSDTLAIAFDFDGTLLPNTTEIFFNSWRKVSIRRDGIDFTFDDYMAHEVNGCETLYDYLCKKVGSILDKEAYFSDIYREYMEDIDGWMETINLNDFFDPLSILEGRFKLALVTHSKREFVEKILSKAGYDDFFDLLICREDLKALKPDPYGYWKVAEHFGIDSKCILVVEDSLKGIGSAKEAGARVVMVSHHENVEMPKDIPTIGSCAELALISLAI